MISALAPALLLLVATVEPTPGDSQATVKLQMAQAELKRGDFQGALKTLDAAAAQASDDALLSRIYLLRGQCFAASQDFAAADNAFRKALEHDPEATLDPAKVDPTVVRMVESLRTQMRGELRVQADHPDATLNIDGRPAGALPHTVSLSIGRHLLEAKTADGKLIARRDVVIRSKRTTDVQLSLAEAVAPGRKATGLEQSKPVADLRILLSPLTSGDVFGIELGGGLEYQFFRLTLHANLYPNFGITPRLAVSVPVAEATDIYLSMEVPIIFSGPTAFGLGGAGGAEYKVSKWLGLFAEIGVRHFFTGAGEADPNRLTIQPGFRLRIP